MAEKPMHNCNYNLLKALTKKANAVTKYDQYIEDAEDAGHSACAALWKELREEDQRHVEKMKSQLEELAQEGKLE